MLRTKHQRQFLRSRGRGELIECLPSLRKEGSVSSIPACMARSKEGRCRRGIIELMWSKYASMRAAERSGGGRGNAFAWAAWSPWIITSTNEGAWSCSRDGQPPAGSGAILASMFLAKAGELLEPTNRS